VQRSFHAILPKVVALAALAAFALPAAAQSANTDGPGVPAAAAVPCADGAECPTPIAPPPPALAVNPPVAAGTLPSPAPDLALVARIQELRAERAAVRLGGPIAMLAAGGGLLLAGATLGIQTFFYSNAYGSCGFGGGCLTPLAGRALGGTAAALGVAGIVLISVGAPSLRARLRVRRALGEQIQQLLRESQLAFDLGSERAGVVLRAKF
jgi:hypothetical protein